ARETRNTYRLGAYLRPRSVKGLKVNTWYRYRTDDDPAYATTVANGHEGFASLTLAPGGRWGGTLNGRLAWEENNERAISQTNAASTQTEYHVDRRRLLSNLGAGVWTTVKDSVHLSLNYGYFRTRIVQDLVFGQDTANLLTLEDEDVQYVQQVHTATAAASWRIAEALTALFEGHYSRSRAAYDPDFATTMDFPLADPDPPLTLPVDSSGLKEVSKLDIQQFGLQAGLDWSPEENWTCSARYRYDDYNDNLSGLFEGSSQTVTVTLARAW
ncbi:MAG TPA: hypothetical protein VKA48_07060, partial [Gammaproteobacteria bacterium]|nr:hypothetical protein [Gammaproteobacteria bacterium]